MRFRDVPFGTRSVPVACISKTGDVHCHRIKKIGIQQDK